jgi:hypothetical protein
MDHVRGRLLSFQPFVLRPQTRQDLLVLAQQITFAAQHPDFLRLEQ